MADGLARFALDEGDRAFIERLYRDYDRLMYAVAWRYFSQREAVEDAVSDSSLALIRNVATLRDMDDGALRSYICVAVRNTALTLLARQRRAQARSVPLSEALELTLAGGGADFEARVELAQELSDTWEAIQSLPPREREIMILKYSAGASDAQITDRLGVPRSSIRKYVNRARRHIRAGLERRGGAAEAARPDGGGDGRA